jgi:hypothetical protein
VSGYVLGEDAELDLADIWEYIAGSRDIPTFLHRRM